MYGNAAAEGYPGRRYHAGCSYIDEIEEYAIELAKSVFHAQYANVQPHSATTANEIVLFSLLEPGDVQLFGPREGLVLSGKDYNMKLMIKGKNTSIEQHFQRAVFPFFQGAPAMNLIAGKAMALKYTQSNEFVETMGRVLYFARIMADYFMIYGYKVISKGTDTHLFLIDLENMKTTGKQAEEKLELCGIIVNKNGVPNKENNSKEPMGIRIGTNSIAQRKLSERDVIKSAELIDLVLNNIDYIDKDSELLGRVKNGVIDICTRNPINWYR